MKPRVILVLAMVVLLYGHTSVDLYGASFQGVGDLPGNYFESGAFAVSADGLVVVGQGKSESGTEAFRWESGTMVGLGDLPGEDFRSRAWGVSSDGSVIVGESYSVLGDEPFRWEDGTMIGLGYLHDDDFRSGTKGVSANGSVIAGYCEGAVKEAFRWENGTMVGLGYLPGGQPRSGAESVSDDGSVVVGYSESGLGTQAFRWENGTMVGLGDLPGGRFASWAFDVSADGSVVVGMSVSGLGTEAFRWENGAMIGLGDLPGGPFGSRAKSCSADGSIVVGYSYDNDPALGGAKAFIWDAEHGMRRLRDVLISDFGLDLTGWILSSANGISADGLTIVGEGTNHGRFEGWIAALGEPTNAAPAADAGDDQTVEQTDAAGAEVHLDGSGSSDPDGDALTYEWTWNGQTASGVAPVVPIPPGLTTVTLTVSDGQKSDTDTVDVLVQDTTPPQIYIGPPAHYGLYKVGELALTFSATDATCEPLVLATLYAMDGQCDVPVGFVPDAGVYTLVVGAWDDSGNAAFSDPVFFVIYDPEGGFVTGGGWIWSPVGAYVADPTLEGKANFGFVSKYKRGASVPTGNTEFVFQAADLNFHSTSYDWLVVAGAKAMFKGVGTINGAGNYGFMLSAVDAAQTPSTNVDLFRIKIWDKNNADTLVYDNQMGDDENADLTTAISGGNIMVHTR